MLPNNLKAMKILILSITTLLFSFISKGQSDTAEIRMISEYGSKNKEIANLLLFQDLDYYTVKFIGNNLKNKYYTLLVKEIWDGKIKNTDTIINSKTNSKLGTSGTDTLSLTVLASKVDKNKLKLFFRFPMVGINRQYKATLSNDYSLKDVGSNEKIESNKYFPAFAYILPHIEDNWKNYCGVTQSGISIYDWGKEFKLKHYLVFEMKFED